MNKNFEFPDRVLIIDKLFNISKSNYFKKSLSNKVIHLAIILLDKYVELNPNPDDILNLGITCLILSDNLESENYLHTSYNVIKLEFKILKDLKYKCLFDTIPDYLLLNKNKLNYKEYKTAIFLANILLYSSKYRYFSSSELGENIIKFILNKDKEKIKNNKIFSYIQSEWIEYNKQNYYIKKIDPFFDIIINNDFDFKTIYNNDYGNLIDENYNLDIYSKKCEYGNLLGSGSYADVYLIKINNENFAIKKIKNQENENIIENFTLR